MNLLALRESVRDLGYDGEPDGRLTRRINAAYREIAGLKRWPWLERSNDDTLVTAVGNTDVSLNAISGLMWVDAVRLAYNGANYELTYLEPQDFQEESWEYPSERGVPLYWTEQATVLRFSAAPAAVYSIALDYLTTPPDLVADEDEPLFDSTYHDALVWGTAVDLTFRQRESYAGQTALARYDAWVSRMVNGYGLGQRQQSDQVKSYWRR